jgi:5-methylcytosine-specific restriction endonuclease McrA
MEISVSSYVDDSRGMNKTCPRCEAEKSLIEFPKDKNRKDGLYPICKECHNRRISERCKEDEELRNRRRERCKKYVSANREKVNAYVLEWHREKRLDPDFRKMELEKSRLFEQTPERKRQKMVLEEKRKPSKRVYNNNIATPRARERYNSDPEYHERVRNQKNARHHRSKTNGGSFTETDWKFLVDLADGKCLSCGMEKKLTIDHIIPVNSDGPTNIDNIQPLCPTCNSSKGDKTIDYRSSEFKEKVLEYQT